MKQSNNILVISQIGQFGKPEDVFFTHFTAYAKPCAILRLKLSLMYISPKSDFKISFILLEIKSCKLKNAVFSKNTWPD